MLAALEEHVHKYNEEAGMRCADIDFSNGEVIIAVATPLMQRVHKMIPQSSELVFVDSTGKYNQSRNTAWNPLEVFWF